MATFKSKRGPEMETDKLWLVEAKNRKDVKPSPVAAKAIAKAPPNLAMYDDAGELHPVVQHVLKIVQQFQSTYMNQWSFIREKWEKADEFFWMKQKEARLQDLTRAIVSSPTYHRVVRRLADGAYLASFTEEQPVKFFPDIGVFEDPEQKRRKAVVAEALNRWALYCMRRTQLREKARESYHYVYKYGNHIAYVPYDYQIETRKRYEPQDMNEVLQASDGTTAYRHKDTEETSANPWPFEMREIEYDEVVRDEVGFYPLHIDACFLDNRIDDLDRQTVFMWRTDVTRAEIWREAKAGKWKNIDKITQLQQFQQYDWENWSEQQRIRDAGKTTTDSFNTEVYERWQAWILMPRLKLKMGKNGSVTDMEWEQNGEPRRYVMECVGDITGPAVVVRFCESPYWGNGIPFVDAHSHKDDSGWYHRGLQELLEDNMFQEQTAKGQLMDNRTLRNFRPIIRQVGRVKTKDLRITHNTTFDVYAPGAIEFMDVQDISGTIGASLQYLKDESEQVAQTPPFFLGEAMGSRTSATEFAAIRDQSSAPALNDIKDINMQLVGGYMKKVKEYAPQFLDKGIAIETTGPQGEEAYEMVHAEDFNADLILQDVAVQEFENKSTMRQILLNLVQIVAQPAIAPFINIGGFLQRIFKTFSSVFPNPEEILNKDPQTMAILQQYLSQKPPEQDQAALSAGMSPMQGIPSPGMPPNIMALTGIPESQPTAGVAGAAGGM